MFYVLSKIFLFLISPGFWIIFLLALSFVVKNQVRKKRLRVAVLVLFIIFTNPWLLNVLVRNWQVQPAALPQGKKYSAAILLGGVTMTDKQNRTFFGSDADRFIQLTRLYHSGRVDYVAVTGGSPSLLKKNRIAEASRVYPELLAQGIPPQRIVIETESKNTYENAVLVKRKLDSLRLPQPYLLVSSALHLPRAAAVFNKAGMQVVPYPAAYKQIDSKRDLQDYLAPSFHLLTEWRFFLKEVVGLWVYRITGKA